MAKTVVRFLVRSIDAPGGVARSLSALASELADSYQVEIVSLFRRRDAPVYALAEDVRLTYLADHRAGRGRRRRSPRSRLINPADTLHEACSLWTDLLLLRALRSMRTGVLVTTRPSLAAVAARFAPSRLVIIDQEHINADTRPEPLKNGIRRAAARGRLHGIAVLTDRDRSDWCDILGDDSTVVRTIANPVPWPVGHDGRQRSRVVVGAGRLMPQKGFDRLVKAWALLAPEHPDWRLHIYGKGRFGKSLQGVIDKHGLADVVELKGWTGEMSEVLSDASVFALSSRYEGLPMVVLEALGRGLPVVAFDCPRGPRELVSDAVNGFLVADGELAPYAAALSKVMDDHALRARLQTGAFQTAERYSVSVVAEQWRELIDELTAGSAASRPHLVGQFHHGSNT